MGLFNRKRLVVTVALLLFMGGLLAFLLWPRADELARWKAERRAQGERFTLSEIAPKFSTKKQDFIKLRCAIAGLGIGATWEALQAPGWDDARLAALDAAWARVELLKRMPAAFEIERAWGWRSIQSSPSTDGAM